MRRLNARQEIEIAAVADFRSELRRFLRRTEAAAAANGLTPQRYDLLLQVHAAAQDRGATISALTGRLSLPQPAVSELVKRAEHAGLVERRPDADDGRVARLRLTAEGSRRVVATFTELRADRAALRELVARLPR